VSEIASSGSATRWRSGALLALALFAALLGAFVVGCADRQPHAVTVPQLLSESGSGSSQVVRVAGVFADAPVSSAAGTMFTMAESRGSTQRLRVYYGTTPLLPMLGQSSDTTPGMLVGREFIVTGVFDGDVLKATALIVKISGGYKTGTSGTVSP
jgi:hypothetical protein